MDFSIANARLRAQFDVVAILIFVIFMRAIQLRLQHIFKEWQMQEKVVASVCWMVCISFKHHVSVKCFVSAIQCWMMKCALLYCFDAAAQCTTIICALILSVILEHCSFASRWQTMMTAVTTTQTLIIVIMTYIPYASHNSHRMIIKQQSSVMKVSYSFSVILLSSRR